MEIKVSIIIPVYNAESTIVKCLDSVVSQSLKEIEIILIDDESTDSSITICKKYSDLHPNISVYQQKNAGPASARNRGIKLAKGKYVYFVDADDYIDSMLVEKMYDAAELHSAELVICHYERVTKKGIVKYKYQFHPGVYKQQESFELAESMVSISADGGIPPYSCIRMINRQFLLQNELFYDEKLMRSEDYHLFTRMHFMITTMVILEDDQLYHYVDNGSSITHSYIKHYWEDAKFIYKDLISVLPELESVREKLDVMLVHRALISMNNAIRNEDTRKSELGLVIKDPLLLKVIDQINVSEGKKEFGVFFILMKCKLYFLVKMKYLL